MALEPGGRRSGPSWAGQELPAECDVPGRRRPVPSGLEGFPIIRHGGRNDLGRRRTVRTLERNEEDAPRS